MQHFVGRTDLILYCHRKVKSRACQRAFATGRVEVLGLFRPIGPGTDLPGWIVRITSPSGTDWYVGVLCELLGYCAFQVAHPRWGNWAGDPLGGQWTLHNGDNPELYGRLRDGEIPSGTSSRLDDDAGSPEIP